MSPGAPAAALTIGSRVRAAGRGPHTGRTLMLRRTILLSVLAVVAPLAVADAHAKTRHFFGHGACGQGSARCPRQHREFTVSVRGRSLRSIDAPFKCVYSNGS